MRCKKEYICPFEYSIDIISGKWKGLILWHLFEEKRRYGELKKEYPEISQKMLSLTLKELENDGIISRKIYPTIPPKVEYSMTNKGKRLFPIFKMLFDWGKEMLDPKETPI